MGERSASEMRANCYRCESKLRVKCERNAADVRANWEWNASELLEIREQTASEMRANCYRWESKLGVKCERTARDKRANCTRNTFAIPMGKVSVHSRLLAFNPFPYTSVLPFLVPFLHRYVLLTIPSFHSSVLIFVHSLYLSISLSDHWSLTFLLASSSPSIRQAIAIIERGNAEDTNTKCRVKMPTVNFRFNDTQGTKKFCSLKTDFFKCRTKKQLW